MFSLTKYLSICHKQFFIDLPFHFSITFNNVLIQYVFATNTSLSDILGTVLGEIPIQILKLDKTSLFNNNNNDNNNINNNNDNTNDDNNDEN